MGSFFKKSIDIGGYATTLWSFLPAAVQTTITGVLAAVTAYFGFYEVGVARAIFYSAGVLAFGMAFVFLWIRISQMVSTYQRLSVVQIQVPNTSLNALRTHIAGINVQIVLRNDSQMPMFYKIKRSHNAIERIGPKDTTLEPSVLMISPNGGTAVLNFATIEDVPFPDKKKKIVNGVFEIELEYGPEIDSLKFLLHYKTNLSIAYSPMPNSKEFRVDAGGSIKLYQHSRI